MEIVLTWLSTAPGGAERSVAELAGALHRLGHRVRVVLWEKTPGVALPDGVEAVRPTCSAAYRRALDEALAPGAVLIGTHRTAAVDIETAHMHGCAVVCVLRALLVPGGRLRMLDAATGELAPAPLGRLDWERLAGADCWVGVSAAATDSLLRSAPLPVQAATVYNGVALPARGRGPRAPGGVRRLAVACRLEGWKRVDRVLSAFAALPAWATDRARLEVFGDGSARPDLQAMADRLSLGDRVRFRGHLSDWSGRADVLVSASTDEAFGRTVVEAGAAGLPQIVPDRGGQAELVLDEITGLVYDADDAGALTEAMARAVAWPEERRARLARAARAHALRYGIEPCAAAYADLAADLAADRLPVAA